MIILGLGSNLGRRIDHLRTALYYLKKHAEITVKRCSPVYCSEAHLMQGSPKEWARPYLNCAIEIDTSLSPEACLFAIKTIEATMGRRQTGGQWSPRIIDIDILEWQGIHMQKEELTIPHARLMERPFSLFPLLDLNPFWRHPCPAQNNLFRTTLASWGTRFDGHAPFKTRQIHQRIDGACLMGILNITPDSFSDGHLYLNPEKAVQHAQYLVQSGATIIDIGAESTRPGASAITPETEWERLEPILSAMQNLSYEDFDPPILCVDTRHTQTAERALQHGIAWLNDVSGLSDPRYVSLVRESGCKAIFMHQLGIPADKKNILPLDQPLTLQVKDWIIERMDQLLTQGILPSQLIADIGIGFGKSAVQDFFILQHIHDFLDLPIPLLVGHSCKYFLGQLFTGRPAALRQLETAILSAFLSQAGVPYLRVHDPELNARAIAISSGISGTNLLE